MRVAFKQDPKQWIKAGSDWEKIVAHAGTAAVRQVAINARDAARKEVASSAGFGPQWQESFKYSMHPKRGDVLNPWAWVHSTINFSDVFETGKTIIGGKAFLWLPLPAVPKYPGTGVGKIPLRQMTPSKYVKTIGPLRTINRGPGKAPMLGAVVSVSASGKITQPKKQSVLRNGRFVSVSTLSKRQAKRTEVIPLFVGVPLVVIQKRFDVAAVIVREAAQLTKIYEENLVEYKGP